jgi:hypothetical protein
VTVAGARAGRRTPSQSEFELTDSELARQWPLPVTVTAVDRDADSGDHESSDLPSAGVAASESVSDCGPPDDSEPERVAEDSEPQPGSRRFKLRAAAAAASLFQVSADSDYAAPARK